MTRYCTYCGTQVEEDSRFCHSCGKPRILGESVTAAEGAKPQGFLSPTSSNYAQRDAAVGAQLAPAAEKVFFKDQGVIVTNSRFVVPDQTFAMAGVTSVKSDRTRVSRAPEVILAIFTLLLFAAHQIGMGIFLLAVVVIVFMARQPKYFVALQSASGEKGALEGKDEEFINKVIAALNDAIIFRQ